MIRCASGENRQITDTAQSVNALLVATNNANQSEQEPDSPGDYHRLRDHGNIVVVIEHNLDVIKTADWIIDLGQEGGDGGGQIIAKGTPPEVKKMAHSHTGRFLKPL